MSAADRARAAAYYAANRERVKARVAAYKVANPEKVRAVNAAWRAANKERMKKNSAAFYAKNKVKMKKTAAAWNAANPEKMRMHDAAWRIANPDKANAKTHRYRARRRRAAGAWSSDDLAAMRSILGSKCLCCGSIDRIAVDHVVPLSMGGTNHPTNLQPLCIRCNSSKGTRSTDYRSRAQARRIRALFGAEVSA